MYEQTKVRRQTTIDQRFLSQNDFFAKTSSREVPQMPAYSKKDLLQSYKNELEKFSDSTQENSHSVALLNAVFLALRVMYAEDAIFTFRISERICQEMLLVTETENPSDGLLKENIIL